jgi:hypothetical protein
MADMKIEIAAKSSFFYPDVFVTCPPDDHRAELAMHHPVLLAEVLSPSTAAHDRGDKFIAYRRLPPLKEYLLIDPDQQQLSSFAKVQTVGGDCTISPPAKRCNWPASRRRFHGNACLVALIEVFDWYGLARPKAWSYLTSLHFVASGLGELPFAC